MGSGRAAWRLSSARGVLLGRIRPLARSHPHAHPAHTHHRRCLGSLALTLYTAEGEPGYKLCATCGPSRQLQKAKVPSSLNRRPPLQVMRVGIVLC